MKKIITSIAVFGAFFLTTTVLFSNPAQAAETGFSMAGHYKYLLGLQDADKGLKSAMGHGVQVDFLWGLGTEGNTKVPSVALGFDVAGGGLSGDAAGGFYKVAFLSEFNLKNGIGFTLGVGGAHLIIQDTQSIAYSVTDIWGIGFTDLGVRYSTKNGLIFSTSIDLMFDPVTAGTAFSQAGDDLEGGGSSSSYTPQDSGDGSITFILGVAVGVGYRF